MVPICTIYGIKIPPNKTFGAGRYQIWVKNSTKHDPWCRQVPNLFFHPLLKKSNLF
jgi:hypothetical protein